LAFGQISGENVGMRIETILHTVLKFQIDCSYIRGREMGTKIGWKVE